tara:strand:+ start:336 stop:1028 length:693 start_codon:yes stop_codon:yes gene_type:complete
MLIQNLNKIIFIHGWLFGSYIWREIQGHFPNVSSSELVSLPGYYKSSAHEHSHKVIDSILGSSKKDDTIIAYSYTAARILLSSELNRCDATIILINPFLKPKTRTITILRDNLVEDFDNTVKKFIFECVKGNNLAKKNFIKLKNLFYSNYIPKKDSLIAELDEMANFDLSKFKVNFSENLMILLSDSDEVCDTRIMSTLKHHKMKIVTLKNSPHYPFFDFKEICETIELL